MKPFAGWRAVGRAMLDARRREGVTVNHDPNAWHGHEWVRNSADTVSVHTGQRGCSLMVDLAGWRHLECGGMDAATALRVLAALDLVPAEIAYAVDERYGRCQKCDELAQWVPPSGQFAGRWCHLDPNRPYHRPEVADRQRCQNCAPGYDCESGIYTPTDLAEAGPAAAPTQEREA